MPRWITADTPRELPEPLDIPETLKAYFAGHFDADANVDISRHKDYSSWSLHTCINPRNADVRVLERYQGYFGRKIGDVPKKKSKQWQTSGEKAAVLLVTIYPYLRIKKREVQYGLAFYQKYPTIPASERDELCSRYSNNISALHKTDRELESFGDITEELRAYLAGNVDGDGTVGLDENSTFSGFPMLEIASDVSCIEHFQTLKEKFGGYIGKDGEGEGMKWRITSARAVSFLRLIYPYLFLKQEQCRLALEYVEKRESLPRLAREAKKELFSTYKTQISRLNQRRIS